MALVLAPMDIFILQKVLSTWSWWNLKSRSYAPDRIISIDLGQGLELLPGIDLKTQALREIGTAHQFTVLPSFIPKMALYSLSFPPGISDVTVAFVVTETNVYGLTRMFQAYSDIYAKTQVMVYESHDEAEKWMREEEDRCTHLNHLLHLTAILFRSLRRLSSPVRIDLNDAIRG